MNKNQIISHAIPTEWFFLTKRPDVPPLPVWYKLKLGAKSRENAKIYGTAIPWACFWYDNNTEFYLHGPEYRLAIGRATRILYSPKRFKAHLKKLKSSCAEAKKSASIFENNRWKNFDNKKLLTIYRSILKKYARSFIYGFITWCTPVLEKETKMLVERKKWALKTLHLSPEQALALLIVPDQTTDYQKKEKILNELSRDYQRVLNVPKKRHFLETHHPKLSERIDVFIKKYGWVGFNYAGPAMNYDKAVQELATRAPKKPSSTPTKKKIYEACAFQAREKHILHALKMVGYTKDVRNTSDDYIHYCLNLFYQECSKRSGLRQNDIVFLWDEELKQLNTGRKKFSPKYISRKKKFCAAFSGHKKLGIQEYFVGQAAERQRKRIMSKSERSDKNPRTSRLTGTIAATGRVTGPVTIIHSATEISKVQTGDVLITGMTSPQYMPAILKAAAIITDDGGLTCHAAIIARELKKPCIIGTKSATSVFHDGDFVEVNADKGEIKTIQK